MRKEEIEYIETEVRNDLIPEIRKMIPTVLGWILKSIFPKLEQKIIDFVVRIVEQFLSKK